MWCFGFAEPSPCQHGFGGSSWCLRSKDRTNTHSDIGFQLDSIATMGRKARERHGEKSARIVWLNNVCTLTVSVVASRLQGCGGKTCLWGKYHAKRPWINSWKSRVTACGKTQQVHNAASRIASRPIYHCLRWAVSDSGPLPPCLRGKLVQLETLRNRVWHTQEAEIGAHAEQWKEGPFPQKPPAGLQVVPFLGVELN